jgi:two-component system nitrate/nitrite response regulator NarL
MTEVSATTMTRPILTLLVCSIWLYRESLASILAAEADISLCGYADPNELVFAAYDASAPDIVLFETGTRGALEIATQLTRTRPHARVLGFGVHDLPGHVVACAEAGLAGYVPNTASLQDLVMAVRRTAAGETVCSAAMAAGLFRHVQGTALGHHAVQPDVILTQRQRQIARLMADGLSNKEIARRLTLQTSTVKNHVHEVLDRLNVTSRNQVGSSLHHHVGP